MRIAIDLRSLHTGKLSGIENYILNVVEYLLLNDKENNYTLFYNSFKPVNAEHFHFVNSTIVKTRIPNKIFNATVSLFGYPKFEKIIGDFDCLFLPNFNPFSVGSTKKLAVTVHDISPFITPQYYKFKDRIWHKVLKIPKVLNRADVIFAVSNYTKNDLIRYFGVPEEKIKVVYPGIEKKVFKTNLSVDMQRQVRNEYGLPAKYILFINTLEPRKNLLGLIEAFENIKDEKAHLVIAGKPGYQSEKSFMAMKKSKKKNRIHYLGYIEERDKPYIMSLASALAYPSFYEGFGFQPLESMALGVPVVTSSVTSLPEVVGDAGLLVNPYNISDIAKALDTALNNEVTRGELIKKGFERVKFFDWQKTSEQIHRELISLK